MGTNGNGGKSPATLPAWRYGFFAAVIVGVLVGGSALDIPREVQVPVVLGCIIAIANGELPRWFGRGDK